MEETELIEDVVVGCTTSSEHDCTVLLPLLPYTGVGWMGCLTAQSPKPETNPAKGVTSFLTV